MSNYGNYDPNDPLRREPPYDPDAKAMNAAWGWIAAAVFLVAVLAVAFGIGHQGDVKTASNDATPPAAQHMSPPATQSPAPSTMTQPAPKPITPAPSAPAPSGNGQ